MSNSKARNIVKYVVPTMLSSVCFFLFTIVDGIFVGRGVGTNGLGAVNLVMPFVMVVNALFMLSTIGGVTITAIRLGRGDTSGANQAFMHAVALNLIFAVILLQGFCRNDGSPVLVSAAVVVSTVCNIFGDWLLIFPIPWGLKGAYSLISYVASFTVTVFLGAGEGLQPLFGQSCGAKDEQGLKTYFRAGMSINLIGSVLINILLLFVGGHVCALFGADADTLAFTVKTMPMYACGFIAMAPNVMISAYLYSTKRSKQAIIINILRSLAANSILILLLPKIFGSGGRELGKRLADALGVSCYDQEIIDEVARCIRRATGDESPRSILRQMERIDRERRAHRELFSDGTWGHKENYHLCINTSGWEIKALVPIVAHYAQAWLDRD